MLPKCIKSFYSPSERPGVSIKIKGDYVPFQKTVLYIASFEQALRSAETSKEFKPLNVRHNELLPAPIKPTIRTFLKTYINLLC